MVIEVFQAEPCTLISTTEIAGCSVRLSKVFSGVEIVTPTGSFGVVQRDGGIEVRDDDGKLVWASVK